MERWTILNIPDETVRRLKSQAAARGLTIGAYLAWLADNTPSEAT